MQDNLQNSEKNNSDHNDLISHTKHPEEPKRRFWEKITTVILALIGSGLLGAWINSMYSERIAKRENWIGN